MNIIRLLTIAIIVYLVIRLYKQWSANKKICNSTKKGQEENMVRCEVCQLHISEKEALKHKDKYYCSQQHLDQQSD